MSGRAGLPSRGGDSLTLPLLQGQASAQEGSGVSGTIPQILVVNLKNGKAQPQAPTVCDTEDREVVASGDTGPGCMGAVTQACGRKATGSGTDSPRPSGNVT